MDKPLFTIELSKEVDGRWIADIRKFSGVMAYGLTVKEATSNVIEILIQTVGTEDIT